MGIFAFIYPKGYMGNGLVIALRRFEGLGFVAIGFRGRVLGTEV